MGRGAGQDTTLTAAPRRVIRRPAGIAVHNWGADRFFSEPPTPTRLGAIATGISDFGRMVHATSVGAHFERNTFAFANEDGVDVSQTPDDLPFMEHPEYGAPAKRQLIDQTPIAIATSSPRLPKLLPMEAAADFIERAQPVSFRAKLPDGRELRADGSYITLVKQVPRRFFGHKEEVVERIARKH